MQELIDYNLVIDEAIGLLKSNPEWRERYSDKVMLKNDGVRFEIRLISNRYQKRCKTLTVRQ